MYVHRHVISWLPTLVGCIRGRRVGQEPTGLLAASFDGAASGRDSSEGADLV